MNIPEPPPRFSTFEVARICGVYHTTVSNWIKKGLLKAISTPGRHRRVSAPDLTEFMRRFALPIPPDLASWRERILIMEDDPAVQIILLRALRALSEVEIEQESLALKALVRIGQQPPDLLIVDVGMPDLNGLKVIEILRGMAHLRPMQIFVVTGEDIREDQAKFIRENSDGYFRKPLDARVIAEAAAQALDVKLQNPEAVS